MYCSMFIYITIIICFLQTYYHFDTTTKPTTVQCTKEVSMERLQQFRQAGAPDGPV